MIELPLLMLLHCLVNLSLIAASFASSILASLGLGMVSMAFRASFGVDRSEPLINSVAARWIFSSFLQNYKHSIQ